MTVTKKIQQHRLSYKAVTAYNEAGSRIYLKGNLAWHKNFTKRRFQYRCQ